jgi:hypothetical protein
MDNITIVLIVVAIAAGIYFFTKKDSTTSEAPVTTQDTAPVEVAPVEAEPTTKPARKGGKSKVEVNTAEM